MCIRKPYYKYISVFFFLIFALSSLLNAQVTNDEIHERILGEFGVDTLIMLEKHFDHIAQGVEMQKEVDVIAKKISTLKDNKKPKRARISALTVKVLQDMIDITRIYEESFENIYAIYSARLMEYPIFDFDKFTRANEFLVEALEMGEDSKGKLSGLTFDDADSTIFKIINEANLSRFQTLYKMQDAFCVYIDCPQEKQDTLTITIVEEEQKKLSSAFVDHSWDWLNDPVDTTSWVYVEERNDFVIFRVQIIAVQKELSKERVADIYSGYADIYVDKTGGFYQYWVGSFFTYNEALRYSEVYGNNSFVIALKANERISVRKAIEETSIETISAKK